VHGQGSSGRVRQRGGNSLVGRGGHWSGCSGWKLERLRLVELHNASGCFVVIEVRRESGDGLPCLLGPLGWLRPQQESRPSFKDTMKQLEAKLKEGKIAVKAEIDGRTTDVPLKTWLHKMFALSRDESVGGHTTVKERQARRLRFDREAIIELWPVPEPVPEPRHRRLHGAALRLPFRAELVQMATSHFGAEGYGTREDISKWISNEALSKNAGGIDNRTAKKWAEKVEQALSERDS
jgi:hypothetical protein